MPDKTTDLPSLETRHAELYRELAPTLSTYTKMAAEALTLQAEIYRRRLTLTFPSATVSEKPRVLTFSARESLASFKQMLASLSEKQVQVSDIIYDPARQEFQIFARP